MATGTRARTGRVADDLDDPSTPVRVRPLVKPQRNRKAEYDDPEWVNSVLEEADRSGVDPEVAKRDRAHVQAHKENIRRDRRTKAQAAASAKRAAAERDRAHGQALAEDTARTEARKPAARLRAFQSRTRQVSDAIPTGSSWGGGLSVSDASGFVLATLGWCWVVLPFIQGGPSQVRDTLRAKFFNKDANGHYFDDEGTAT